MQTVEPAVEAVRAQLQALLAKKQPQGARPRVDVHWLLTPRPCWQLTARRFKLARMPNLSFTAHHVELGKDRIVVPESDPLEIISAAWKGGTFTVCIAHRVLSERTAKFAESFAFIERLAPLFARHQEPASLIFAKRAIRGISHVIEHTPIQALAEAAAATSDLQVILRALEQPDAIETLKVDDPLAPARLRGLHERERLLEIEGGMWTAPNVAKHLKLTRQTVNHRRKQGALIGLDAGRHGYLYPAWQFVREGTVPGLEALLPGLWPHDPWMQHVFMVSPNARLGNRTPLDVLRAGGLEDVLTAARSVGEHGAA